MHAIKPTNTIFMDAFHCFCYKQRGNKNQTKRKKMIMLAKQYIKGFIYQEDRSYKQTKKTDKHKIHIEARPDYKATQSSQNTITT